MPLLLPPTRRCLGSAMTLVLVGPLRDRRLRTTHIERGPVGPPFDAREDGAAKTGGYSPSGPGTPAGRRHLGAAAAAPPLDAAAAAAALRSSFVHSFWVIRGGGGPQASVWWFGYVSQQNT